MSFGFRGVTKIRESIHAVFLDHAIKESGMDVGIVNAEEMLSNDELEPDMKVLCGVWLSARMASKWLQALLTRLHGSGTSTMRGRRSFCAGTLAKYERRNSAPMDIRSLQHRETRRRVCGARAETTPG